MKNHRGAVLSLALVVATFAGAQAQSAQTATVQTTAAQAGVKRVMIFGDSNTWGYQPFPAPTPSPRYDEATRWPQLLARELGADYEIIEEGLSCRTTDLDDPSCGITGAGMNGAEYLPAAIASHQPLDLVVVMLGTNDTKPIFDRSTFGVALGALRLVDIVRTNTGVNSPYPAPEVLLVSPSPLGEVPEAWSEIFDAQSVRESRELAGVLGPLARAAGVPFFDAGTVLAVADGIDGIHLSPASHRSLSAALIQPVRDALK